MHQKDYLKLFFGLCGSNTAMMAAWYILLPVHLSLWVAILLSWCMAAFFEYPLHVWANAATHGTLGRITQRYINETPNFAAFLLISFLAHESLYWKYFVALALVATVVVFFKIAPQNNKIVKFFRWITVVVVCCWCVISVTWLRVPPITGKLLVSHPILSGFLPGNLSTLLAWVLPGGLPLVWFLGCFVANTLQLFAWYTHPKIEHPPKWFMESPFRRLLFAWGVSIGLAFLEYCVLIPVNRGSYKYISIVQLFGYMEITLVSVFLLGNILAKYLLHEHFALTKKDLVGFILLIVIEAATCIF